MPARRLRKGIGGLPHRAHGACKARNLRWKKRCPPPSSNKHHRYPVPGSKPSYDGVTSRPWFRSNQLPHESGACTDRIEKGIIDIGCVARNSSNRRCAGRIDCHAPNSRLFHCRARTRHGGHITTWAIQQFRDSAPKLLHHNTPRRFLPAGPRRQLYREMFHIVERLRAFDAGKTAPSGGQCFAVLVHLRLPRH